MLLPRLFGQASEKVLRLGEEIIPPALGLQLGENQSADGLLVLFRKLRRLGNRLLKESPHEAHFTPHAGRPR